MKPARDDPVIAPGQTEDTFVQLPKRQVVLTMAGVMLAIFLSSLDQTVVATAVPRIVADLGGFDRFTWISTAYLVAATTAVPIVGRLSDLYGRKSFFVAGIVVFLIGSILAGLSQSMNQLIAFRAIQGLGGGVMMANSFTAVGDLFPPAERGKYQGLVAAVFGLSSVLGPTLGGFITDTLSWHWIFYVNIPLGIPAVGLFLRFFPQSRTSGPRANLDYLGMVTLILAVVPLLVGLSWAGVQYDWASPQVIGALTLSAVMTAAFIVVELTAPEPIMPLDIYKNRVVSISLIAILLTGFGMFGAIIFIPLFFQGVLGSSATSSGSFLTPMILAVVVGATLSGQALSRTGGHYRTQGVFGIAIMGAGMFLISRMTADTSHARAVLNIAIMGFGMGTTFPTFTIAVQNAVSHSVLGVVTSATQFYRSIGGTLGLAILGAVMASRFASGLTTAFSPAVREAVPPELLSQLGENPQTLVNPEALTNLRETLGQTGSEGSELADQIVMGLRESLASAISDVFVISLAVVAVALAATLFLKEVPLRGRQPRAESVPATEPGTDD